MRLKTKISISFLFLLLIIGFQNCSPNNSRVAFTEGASKVASPVNSGTPYEGKIYATVGELCSDGTEIHSRIVLSSATKGELNRDKCRDIAPVEVTSAEFQIDPVSDSLLFRNETFGYIGVGTLGITNLVATNDVNNFYYGYTFEGQPNWLQIFLDTDNNPATGFYREGIGADFMIENDNVWKYSAPNGAPQSTWAWSSHTTANKNRGSQTISWSFARSSIASPALIKLVGQTSLGARTGVVTQTPK